MNKYFSIYLILLRLNFTTLIEYRLNFINSIISSIAWGGMSLFSVYLLTAKVSSVYGWSRIDLLMLTAVYNIVVGTFHTIFSWNFERFSRIIFLGQLDSVLVKPVDSQFLLSFWFFNYTGIIRILLGIGVSFVLIDQFYKTISFVTILQFVVFMVIGIILLYSIWFLCMPFTIWFSRLSNMVQLLYTLNGLSRYPKEMVQQGILLFLFLPVFFVVTTPTKILIQNVTVYDMLATFVFTIVLFFISRKFWLYALRFYTSASS